MLWLHPQGACSTAQPPSWWRISSWYPAWTSPASAWHHSLGSYHWSLRRIGRCLPLHSPLQGSCRPWWGLPSASSSPGWNIYNIECYRPKTWVSLSDFSDGTHAKIQSYELYKHFFKNCFVDILFVTYNCQYLQLRLLLESSLPKGIHTYLVILVCISDKMP